MSVALKSDAGGTFGELLLNGTPVARVGTTGIQSLTGQLTFNQGNILGTVSQSSGVPTGRVIERGSNANGDYVRFADGTQICTFSGFSGVNSGTWTYPAAFASGLAISMFIIAGTGSTNVYSCLGAPGLSSTTFRKKFMPVAGGSWGDASGETLSFYVVGRWF